MRKDQLLWRIWEIFLALFFFIAGILIIRDVLSGLSRDFFASDFTSLNKKDYKNFSTIGENLFLLYDSGYISANEIIYHDDYDDRPKVQKALSKYDSIILEVNFVDKNVVLLSFGAVFQSIDGIAIIRNNAKLKDTYENTRYDTGTLDYSELIPNIYHFTAGL